MSALGAALLSTGCGVLAARVDVRRGEIVERHRVGDGLGEHEDDVLLAALEMLRTQERPRRLFVLSEKHVHLYRRETHEPNLAVVMVAERSLNLGLVLAELGAASNAASAADAASR